MKILVVQLGRIGDMILSTPLYSAIRKLFPDSELHVLCGNSNKDVIRNNPFIDKVIIHDKSPLKLISSLLSLRHEKYDYLIDPKDHYSTESKLIAQLSGAKSKIGFAPAGKRYFNIPLPPQVEYSDLHYSQRCLKSLAHFGYEVPENPPRPELFLDTKSEQYVDEELKGKSNYTLINISASNETKMWSNENWIEFIKFLNHSEDELLMIYPPSSEESAKIIISQSNGITGIRSNNMQDSFSIISRAKLLITPDTSLVHVASAYNIPLLALYSGLDDFYRKFRPLSDIIEVVRSEKGDGSIRSITTDRFIEAYQRIIQKL